MLFHNLCINQTKDLFYDTNGVPSSRLCGQSTMEYES